MACYTNYQIAAILDLSVSTVKNHFSAIYRALCPEIGATDYKRSLAITRALTRGLLSIEDISDGDRSTFVRGHGWVFLDSNGGWRQDLEVIQRPKTQGGKAKEQRNLEIARRRRRGDDMLEIADDFGITRQRIYQICKQIDNPSAGDRILLVRRVKQE